VINLKVGLCPVCNTTISEKAWKKFREKVMDRKRIDCPECGTELFIDPKIANFEEYSINKGTALIKYPNMTMGIEVESFSIDLESLEFKSLAPIYIKEGLEKGEKYFYDKTIGSEYNSPVFTSLNEAFFRIKTGLRKYFINLGEDEMKRIALIASYSNTDNTAGIHYHVAPEEEVLSDDEADRIAPYIHQQIPFLIAITANSPILDGKITDLASNRMIYNGESMCAALNREHLEGLAGFSHFDEINLTAKREDKPPTLEVRVADSNIPEYIIAGLFIVSIAVNSAIKGEKLWNLKHYNQREYEAERMVAANFGAKAEFKFNKARLTIPKYIDAFFNFFKDEIEESNVSEDVLTVFKLAKKGWVMADIVRESWNKIKKEDPDKSEDIVSKIFAAKYIQAQERNLDGENIKTFAKLLGVQLPRLNEVKLGKYF